MHNYPLYHPVPAECLCCHFQYTAEFKSKTDQVICSACTRHLGSSPQDLERRSRDHTARALKELEKQRDAYERRLGLMKEQCAVYRAELERVGDEVNELKSTIADGIAATPPESIVRWWETAAIGDALERRDAAYRSRDHAYRSLWYLDRIHHHDVRNDRQCNCGKTATACKDLQVLDEIVGGLDRWERTQIERHKQGKENGLPWDHPVVIGDDPRSESWRQYRHAR